MYNYQRGTLQMFRRFVWSQTFHTWNISEFAKNTLMQNVVKKEKTFLDFFCHFSTRKARKMAVTHEKISLLSNSDFNGSILI